MQQFLKEILNDLCVYNKRGPNQGTHELKPEYKKSTEDNNATWRSSSSDSPNMSSPVSTDWNSSLLVAPYKQSLMLGWAAPCNVLCTTFLPLAAIWNYERPEPFLDLSRNKDPNFVNRPNWQNQIIWGINGASNVDWSITQPDEILLLALFGSATNLARTFSGKRISHVWSTK